MTTTTKTIVENWSSTIEKTVFVLDRSRYFTHISSGHSIDGDNIKDAKKTAHLYANEPPIESFNRSLWTCTVEAVVGYVRLVWDLFTPDQRCISVVSIGPDNNNSNKKVDPNDLIERICNWQDDHQNIDHLLNGLAKKSHLHQVYPPEKLASTEDISSYPNCDLESESLLSSIDQALNNLATLTKAQKQKKATRGACFENNGRIILISSFRDEKCISGLVDKFSVWLNKKNESLKEALQVLGTESNGIIQLEPIHYCDLVIVNTFPITDCGPCSQITNFTTSKPKFHGRIYSVKSGRNIAGLLNNMCLQHHNLRSTTITGIPMKEEQNASSSSQYDVEIVHCSSIHDDILNSGSPLLEGVIEVLDRNGFACDTFKLSWCTPKTTTVELNHCLATSRITAVDINSRPSACLTNFLLNGRAVALEIFKSKSNRMTTHILASHNGELYIHTLATAQQRLNVGDLPSIVDGLGGKVTDYRLNDFIEFMKQNALCKSTSNDDSLKKSHNIMRRHTLYWPLTLGHTILLNVPKMLGNILRLTQKESISEPDVQECKKVIDDLVKFEKAGQALPSVSVVELIKSINSKSGGNRLEQLYKLLWNELEYFLRVHSTSAEHEAILEYLIERTSDKRALDSGRGAKRSSSKAQTSGQTPAKKMKSSGNRLLPELSHETAQQMSNLYKSGMSLYDTWVQLYQMHHRSTSKLPIVGRSQTPPQQQQQQQSQPLPPTQQQAPAIR